MRRFFPPRPLIKSSALEQHFRSERRIGQKEVLYMSVGVVQVIGLGSCLVRSFFAATRDHVRRHQPVRQVFTRQFLTLFPAIAAYSSESAGSIASHRAGRVDGVEDGATSQHERAVKFFIHPHSSTTNVDDVLELLHHQLLHHARRPVLPPRFPVGLEGLVEPVRDSVIYVRRVASMAYDLRKTPQADLSCTASHSA